MDPVNQLASASLGVHTICWEDLDFKWSRGCQQRDLKQGHILHLVDRFLEMGALTSDYRYNLVVTVDGGALERWAKAKSMAIDGNKKLTITEFF
ncbi:hypothetical protein BDZ91DRAFT_738438 [Kalaharituber pfeilii]|nr:hypothetical protein BDZ91DRAFT_738438 [Kalaharituber pfeilii]